MGFTFQINDDVRFKHDQSLLNKAANYRPKIYDQKMTARSIVELKKDTTLLEGVGVKKIADIHELPKQHLKRSDQVILDFGNHRVGKFSINIDSVGSPMDAPLFLKLKFAEMPAELAQDSADYDGWLSKSWIQEEYVHLDTLPVTLKLPRRYSFRFVELTVLDTSPKWQAVFDAPTVETESAVQENTIKAPELADPKLKRIYQVGLKTLADCMQTVFEDGPKRDRRLWIGDLRLQALADYSTFKNIDIVKRCLYLFGAMPTEDGRIPANVFTQPKEQPDDTFLFDYGLFFISILSDYEEFNPDREVLDDLYNVAKRQMDVALKQVNSEGELQLNDDYPVFIDWSNDFNKATAGQAVLIYTLKQFIELANQKHDADTNKYTSKLTKLTEFANKQLFDTKSGFFVSGKKREVNVASQVWMTLAHVKNDHDTQQLMTQTVKQLFPIKGIATPYMYHHVTQALFEAGLKDEAVQLMKDYWGKMIDLGADTFWEAFDPDKPDYSPYGSSILNSYCHAWSCTPVYLIDKYLS
ncbi:family 78 glycoside hydrolase catalytic domain [Secundilactobacillus folii]|uniref:Bacterial alpha-L-rhamnosidase n=1 Tax=Secundilactobacillus folii TaxID=2678357 RepID=A0A7X2XWT3_9LACO|nr:family 78 glycoside hydrolase catalytic domain [Secundilactobacillus folii]MTV83108.1 Bacterial alpha-L-rhamnosidase [Secundilactobacillus folii]